MIIGIGIDLVDISRFGRQLERTPELGSRVSWLTQLDEKPSDLARNFAVLEALYKALPQDQKKYIWDFRLVKDSNGKPKIEHKHQIQIEDTFLEYHVSITHESSNVIAVVIIEKNVIRTCCCKA
jgi:holo-[acyl-carrier protein] synthase